jgi:hypothetical protein
MGSDEAAQDSEDDYSKMNKKGLWERWRKTTIANQVLVVTGVLMVISSGLYTVTTIYQVRMWKENAKQSGEQTDKLIAASERLANTTNRQAEDAHKANVEMLNKAERLTHANEELVKTATKQANASLRQAKTSQVSASAAQQSANAAAKTFSIGERPYIAVKEMSLTNLAVNQRPTTMTIFENAGRTPALNAQFRTCIQARGEPLPNPPVCATKNDRPASPVFMPAGGVWRMIVPFADTATEGDVQYIKSGKSTIYVWGSVEYDDGVGKRHVLKYCAFYNPNNPGVDQFTACTYGNESN